MRRPENERGARRFRFRSPSRHSLNPTPLGHMSFLTKLVNRAGVAYRAKVGKELTAHGAFIPRECANMRLGLGLYLLGLCLPGDQGNVGETQGSGLRVRVEGGERAVGGNVVI